MTLTVEFAGATVAPEPVWAVTVTWLVTRPASTSAWVTRYEPVQVSVAPAARVESGQEMSAGATWSSMRTMLWRAALSPVLVTTY